VNEEIMKSRGAVVSYQSKLESYKNAKSVIKKVLYFNHIVDTLKNNKKVIVDPRTGNLDLYLNSGSGSFMPEWSTEE
jgi:hypothetical protein